MRLESVGPDEELFGSGPMRFQANLALFPDERPAVMVVSHERSGTHFLMNALAACYGYVSRPLDQTSSG